MRFFGLLLKWAMVLGMVATVEAPRMPAQTPPSYLGVGVVGIDQATAREFGYADRAGILVQLVGADSPAARAGLRPNDVIYELNGKPIQEPAELGLLVSKIAPGHKIRLLVERSGAKVKITAMLAASSTGPASDDRRTHVTIGMGMDGYAPDSPTASLRWRSSRIGVEYEALDNQLAGFFGVKRGVLVRFVQEGSVAEDSGVKAGDVIVGFNGHAVNNPRDLAVLAQRNQENAATMTVVRNRKPQPVSLRWNSAVAQ